MVEKTKKNLNKKEVREALYGDKPRNSRGRGRTETELKQIYRDYYERKRKVVEFEKTNYEFLALLPASDSYKSDTGFYVMGDNSAIMFAVEYGPRIKRSPTLRYDMDNGKDHEKFKKGVCFIRDLSKLEKELATIGVERKKTKDEALILFKLPTKHDAKEIRAMYKQEQERLDKLNAIVYSKVLYPDIHKQIITMKHDIPVKIKNMDPTYRGLVGHYTIDALVRIMKTYMGMTHGMVDEKLAGRTIIEECDVILSMLSMYSELQLLEVSTCIRVANTVNGLRQLVKARIVNKDENIKRQ